MNKQILRNIIIWGLFAIPFIPFLVSSAFFFPFIVTKAFTWRIIVEIIFAAWLCLAFLDSSYRVKKSYILYSVLTFLAVIGLADLFGAAPLKSFWSSFERMEGYITLLHLGMFFVVISSVFSEVEWKRWWNASLVASFIMVLYCVLQILGLKTINQGGVRVDGTLGNAIYLAVYLLFHMFIALLFMVRNWQNATLRWLYGILIILQGIILYFTATRGAILGLIGGLLIVAVLNIRNKESRAMRRASIVLISAIILLMGGFYLARNQDFVRNSPVLSRFASLNTEELKTQGRYFVWPMAIEGWKERPILGWGQENFSFVFQKYYQAEMFILEPWFDRAHNIFLDWLVVGGIVGLLAYLSLYVALLFVLWRRGSNLSYTEKSVITGLIAAYFFHNFFVFDHLISYVLFFALLAYIHRKASEDQVGEVNKEFDSTRSAIVMVPAAIALVVVLYFVNARPLMANFYLIEALKAVQVAGNNSVAIEKFQKSYSYANIGRSEVLEHTASNSIGILSSDVSDDDKNAFFTFIKDSITKEANTNSYANDARFQLLSGAFLSATGLEDEGISYLQKARELIPNKQQVYFELGSSYLSKGDRQQALDLFRQAYELAPSNKEARIIYFIGAIYAGNTGLQNELATTLAGVDLASDDRVINAYYANGRKDKVRELLNIRKQIDPANAEVYQQYIDSL